MPSVVNQGGITPAREAENFIGNLLRDATPDELTSLAATPALATFVDREFRRRRVEGVEASVLPPPGAPAPNPPLPALSGRSDFSLGGRALPAAVDARGLGSPASQRLNLSPQAEIDPAVAIARSPGVAPRQIPATLLEPVPGQAPETGPTSLGIQPPTATGGLPALAPPGTAPVEPTATDAVAQLPTELGGSPSVTPAEAIAAGADPGALAAVAEVAQNVPNIPPTEVVGGNVPKAAQPLATVPAPGQLATPGAVPATTAGQPAPGVSSPAGATDLAAAEPVSARGVAPRQAGGELGALLSRGGDLKGAPTTESEILKFLKQPETTAALLQFAINVLQPLAPGQTTIGAIANALGAGAQAAGRVTDKRLAAEATARGEARKDRQLDTADRRVDVAEEGLEVQREGLDLEAKKIVRTAARDAAKIAGEAADRSFKARKFRTETETALAVAGQQATTAGVKLSAEQARAMAKVFESSFKTRMEEATAGLDTDETLTVSQINIIRQAALEDARQAFGITPKTASAAELQQIRRDNINASIAEFGLDTVIQQIMSDRGIDEAAAQAVVNGILGTTAPGELEPTAVQGEAAAVPVDPDAEAIINFATRVPAPSATTGPVGGRKRLRATTDEERLAEIAGKLPATFEEKPIEFWERIINEGGSEVVRAVAAKFPEEFNKIATAAKKRIFDQSPLGAAVGR